MIDAREGGLGDVVRGRVIIYGAGAAGLTLAQRLSRRMDGVVLVESGGRTIHGPTQALAAGQNVGLPYYNLLSAMLRFFGGTTNHWSGYSRGSDPIDFEPRPDIGIPGWPFSHATLEPWMAEAARLLGIAPGNDARAALNAAGLPTDFLIETKTDALETKVFQITPNRKLATVLGPALDQATGLRQISYLNAVSVVPTGNGRRIDHVLAKTLNGQSIRCIADVHVIACHGIENARLLLDSTSRDPAGVGNASRQLGRNFAEHLSVRSSRFVAAGALPMIYDIRQTIPFGTNANISLTDRSMRAAGTMSYYGRFHPVYRREETAFAVRNLMKGFWRPFQPSLINDLEALLEDPAGVANFARMGLKRDRRPLYYYLRHRIDQAPNPDSRVILSTRRNALGGRIGDLHLAVNDLDVRTMARGQDILAREMSALGMGRFQLEPITRKVLETRLEGNHHFCGTTRMSVSPADGVADGDGRVHGIDNLYLAGSSLFPTPGYGGPTMKIIAMAMRLGDHLLARLGAG